MLDFLVVQSLSCVQLFVTPWPAACQASLSFTISCSFLRLISWVSDAIQPSRPLLPPSLALNLSQYQGLFQWIGSSLRVAKVLELHLQLSASVLPMNIQGWFSLGLTDLISLWSKGLSRVFSRTTIRKHQFLSSQPSLWFNSTSIYDYWKNHSFDYMDLCQQSDVSAF